MKKIILLLLVLITAGRGIAQVKVGDNPTVINPNAVLETESTNKGILITRLALSATNDPSPLTAFVEGMLVYNTATAGTAPNNITPGFYYSDGNRWLKTTTPVTDQTIDVTGLTANLTSPNSFSGATFSPNTPGNSDYIYVNKADGTTWTFTGGQYVSYIAPASTSWYLAGGTNDAASNKTSNTYRPGMVGIGSALNPDPSAQLDVNSTSKGFLPPRMTQVQMNAIATPAAGLMVYCTDCNPASHFTFNGTTWVVLGSASNPTATFTSGTLACTGGSTSLNGTYTQLTAMNSSNTKVVTITATSGGTVTGSTNTNNGVSFSANTTLYSTGANTQIALTASGTPNLAGSFAYTVTLAGQTCNFSVNYAAGATFSCGTITNTLPTSLINGTTYSTGSITLPYTAGSGSAYPTATITNNGLSLTRVAGTYAAGGGSIVYNLSGTYTGATGGNAVFLLPDGGCTVSAGAASFSGSPSCGAPSGNYISGVPMTGSNTVPITVNVTSQGYYTVSTSSANGVSFSGSAILTASGVQAITLTASGTPVTNGPFDYTVTIGGQSCTFTVSFKPVAGYAVANITGSNISVTSGTNMNWTNVIASNNGVTISGTDITLLAGKKYRLSASLSIRSASFISFNFVNSGNTRLTGTSTGNVLSQAFNGGYSTVIPAGGIYTVGATNEVVKVQVQSTSGSSATVTLDGNISPSVVVEELSPGMSYAVANITTTTGTIASGTDISWNNVLTSNGVSVSGSGITLLAGKTYRLRGALVASNTGSLYYSFVNSSNTRLTGVVPGTSLASGRVTTNSDVIPAEGIYTVGATNETIKLRVTVAQYSPTIYGDVNLQSSLLVEEIPSTLGYGVAPISSVISNPGPGYNVVWSAQAAANAGVTISGSSITLKAGRTYSLKAVLSGDQGFLSYNFANSSGTILSGTKIGLSQSPNWGNNLCGYVPAEGIYTVGAADETISLRVVAAGTVSGKTRSIYGTSDHQSSLTIKEIK